MNSDRLNNLWGYSSNYHPAHLPYQDTCWSPPCFSPPGVFSLHEANIHRFKYICKPYTGKISPMKIQQNQFGIKSNEGKGGTVEIVEADEDGEALSGRITCELTSTEVLPSRICVS